MCVCVSDCCHFGCCAALCIMSLPGKKMCVSVYVCVRVCVCATIDLYVNICMCICVCVCVCVSVVTSDAVLLGCLSLARKCACARVGRYGYKCKNLYIFFQENVRVRMWVDIDIYVRIYIYIYKKMCVCACVQI